MIKKKAQLELSFNWIFVLIAGAVILFFFINVISKEKEAGTTQLSQKLSARLEAIFTIIEQNPDSVRIHDALNVELEFNCEFDSHFYGLKGSQAKSYLNTQMLFSPKVVGQSRMVTWVKNLDAPFPVSSILYVTDQKTMYLFVKQNDETTYKVFIEELYDSFPDNFTKKMITYNEYVSFKDQGFREYIVVIDREIALTENFRNPSIEKKSKFVSPLKQTDDFEVAFLSNPLNNGGFQNADFSSFLFEEIMFGAVVSGDKDLFNCVKNKVDSRIKMVAKANFIRVEKLNEDINMPSRCLTYYGSTTTGAIQNIIDDPSPGSANVLKNLNNAIVRAGCPLVY